MKKIFRVSGDNKFFLILRSFLAASLSSLVIFLLYRFVSTTALWPVLLLLFVFNFWILSLTFRKWNYFSSLSLILHDSHLEFREGPHGRSLFWKDIQRVEANFTPIGTRDTLVLFTKDEAFPLHVYEDVDLIWERIGGHLQKSARMVSLVRLWGKEMQLLAATVASFFVLVFLGNMMLQPLEFSFSYFLALVAGLFFVLYRPLSQLLSERITQLEVGLGTLGILIFFFHFFSVIVMPVLDQGEQARVACGSESPQVQAYNLPPEVCRLAWKQFESNCKEELKPWLQTRSPSSLVGPVITKCQWQKFDKAFHFNRR